MRIFILFLLVSFSSFSQEENTNNLKNDQNIKELISKGFQNYYDKNEISLEEVTNELFRLFLKNKDSILLAKYYHFKALKQKLTYTNDSVFYYYHQSKNISKKILDSLSVGKRLLGIAALQRKAKDFLGSEISAIEALQYLEPIHAYKYLEATYNNLGLVSGELYQNNEAINYFNESLKINRLNKNESEKLYTLNNLGLIYQQQDQHEKAVEYFKEGLSFDSIQIKYPEQYGLLLENIVFSNYSKGDKKNTLKKYKTLLNLRESLQDYKELSTTHLNISKFHKDKKESEKSVLHANKSLFYAKQSHNNKRWLEALEILSELHTGEKSTNYLKEYIKLNDSLVQKERALKNQFAKIRYQTDKKEKENTVLKIENEKIEAEVVYHKQQKTIGWLLFAASFFGLGFSVLFFVTRRRKLVYLNKLQKVQAREKERQLIAKSLHDEVAGDLRLLHQKLQKSQLFDEAAKLNDVKENVRNLSHKLSSISFEKVSFKDQIINMVSDYFQPDFKIKVTGINNHDWQVIDKSIKRVLYLSTRECIQNCQKYAQATKVTIDFSVRKKNVFLGIVDNGIGFNTKTNKKGIGLQNLEERLEELNGSLNINSQNNNGTEIHIQIPLNVYKNQNTFRR